MEISFHPFLSRSCADTLTRVKYSQFPISQDHSSYWLSLALGRAYQLTKEKVHAWPFFVALLAGYVDFLLVIGALAWVRMLLLENSRLERDTLVPLDRVGCTARETWNRNQAPCL